MTLSPYTIAILLMLQGLIPTGNLQPFFTRHKGRYRSTSISESGEEVQGPSPVDFVDEHNQHHVQLIPVGVEPKPDWLPSKNLISNGVKPKPTLPLYVEYTPIDDEPKPELPPLVEIIPNNVKPEPTLPLYVEYTTIDDGLPVESIPIDVEPKPAFPPSLVIPPPVGKLPLIPTPEILHSSEESLELPSSEESLELPSSSESLREVCGKNSLDPRRTFRGGNKYNLRPWMAAIFYNNDFSEIHCAGALITELHVLTAAHCITYKDANHVIEAKKLSVVLGVDNMKRIQEDRAFIFHVIEVIAHPMFSWKVLHHDIGLLKLYPPVPFSHRVFPICLPDNSEFKDKSFVGTAPLIGGWGQTVDELARLSVQFFQESRIVFINNTICEKAYGKILAITDNHLCGIQEKERVATCTSDRGSPVIIPDANNRFHIIGIVTFGENCAEKGYPAILTKVNLYLDFIEKFTGINGGGSISDSINTIVD